MRCQGRIRCQPKPRRVTVTLSEDVVGAADGVAAKRACSRSALVEDALR
jgi:metal-responsive CopG/Arc/MetJ family transcriptional regulator